VVDLPDTAKAYLAQVEASPRFNNTVNPFTWSFKLVEITPILAFQVHVETDRANSLWSNAGGGTDLDSLLRLCLPIDIADIREGVDFTKKFDPTNTSERGSVTFETSNPNIRLIAGGPLGHDDVKKLEYAGIALGEGSRLVQVAELNGRFFLRNGYHRAYKMMENGVTHMPCLVLQVSDYAHTGAAMQGALDRRLLESANPPICAHYARGYEVTLKGVKGRTVKVSWSDQLRP
jgi:hypothetical protein